MSDPTIGSNVYEDLRLACVGLFTILIPLLVLVRSRYPEFPAWLMIVLAIALGGILTYAHMAMEAPMHHAWELEMRLAAEEAMRHPSPPVQNADGSISIDNPYGIGDWIGEAYHPLQSLLYGPVYLFGCWTGAWLMSRYCARRSRWTVIVVSVGVFFTMWAAIIGFALAPPGIFSDEIFINGWNPFFGPQLTLALALIVSCMLVGWLPAWLHSTARPGRS